MKGHVTDDKDGDDGDDDTREAVDGTCSDVTAAGPEVNTTPRRVTFSRADVSSRHFRVNSARCDVISAESRASSTRSDVILAIVLRYHWLGHRSGNIHHWVTLSS